MSENYEPSRKEVFGEMYNILKGYFTGNVKNLRGRLAQNKNIPMDKKLFFKKAATYVGGFYAIPSSIRKVKEQNKKIAEEIETGNLERECELNYGFLAMIIKGIKTGDSKEKALTYGIITGCGIDALMLATYASLADIDNPVATIPLVTNAGSCLYEGGLCIYRKAKDKLIENHEQQGLEPVVSASKEYKS